MSECTSVVVTWSGEYPTKCDGVWSIYVDGADMSGHIPPCHIDSPMHTYGEYVKYRNNDDERKVTYKDGLKQDEWIQENYFWLVNISKDIDVLKEIFRQVQANDWRHGCCGGCI